MVREKLSTTYLLIQAVVILISTFAIGASAFAFDVNGDGKEGLAEAIHALQVTAGIIPTPIPIGDAEPADVLVGKTFSNSTDTGLTGTMPNIGARIIPPGAVDKNIPKGYHDGTGTVEGDPDLVTGNIKNGVEIFDVPGDVYVVNTSDGDATAQHIMSAKIAYAAGLRIVGERAYIYGCRHGTWDIGFCFQDCFFDTFAGDPLCDAYCNATATNMIAEVLNLCEMLPST